MERARLLLDATRALGGLAPAVVGRKLTGEQASLLEAYRTVLERRVAGNAPLPALEGTTPRDAETEEEKEQERLRASVAFVVGLGDKCMPVELLKEIAGFLA